MFLTKSGLNIACCGL